jgi:heptosyltransferase II
VSRRVLVIGPAWVGDMVMAQSLFLRLKQKDPLCTIDVVAPAWSLPILARMPQVRNGIELPIVHGEFGWAKRRDLGYRLVDEKYTQAIVLPGSWKSALVPWFAGVPRRTGYRGEMRFGLLNDIRPLDQQLLKTTVERFVALAEDGPVTSAPEILPPRLYTERALGHRMAMQLELNAPQMAVGLMPGAEYGPAKQWPVEYFGTLAKLLASEGLQSWVFGSAKEAALGDRICEISGGAAVNLCGKTELVDVVDLVAICRAVVTNDSGLMHIAAATGTPVAAIYGSSTPDHTPPLTDRKHVHYLRLSCSPCFERTCPLQHTNCLRNIAPLAVRESLRELAKV